MIKINPHLPRMIQSHLLIFWFFLDLLARFFRCWNGEWMMIERALMGHKDRPEQLIILAHLPSATSLAGDSDRRKSLIDWIPFTFATTRCLFWFSGQHQSQSKSTRREEAKGWLRSSSAGNLGYIRKGISKTWVAVDSFNIRLSMRTEKKEGRGAWWMAAEGLDLELRAERPRLLSDFQSEA